MIGVLSVALAIWAQSFVAGHEFPYDGLLLYAVALILAARAFEFPPKGSANGRTAAPVVDGTRRWTVDRSVAPVGAFALAANLLALRLFAANSNPSAAWVLYAGSVVATPVAVWLASGRRRPRPLRDWDLTEAAALGVVLLVAAAFRLFRIDSLPFGLWWDEASYGLQVLHIMNDPSYRPVFVGGASQMPALMWYVMIPFFAAFGPTPLGLRIASATAGVLGVLAVYLLSRELFGKRTGFIAGLLLAVMAWHVNWSRIGMAGVWSVALDALSAFFLIRALRTGSWLSFALAGTALGLGLNMYYSSRLMPLVLALYVGHRVLAERANFFRRQLGGLVVFCVTFLITVSPLAEYAVQHPADFNSRTETVTVFKEAADSHSYQPVVENLRKHLLMFQYAGDRNGRHNLPGAPMLDQVMAALFGLGLMMVALRVHTREGFFLAGWFAVMLAGGVFSLSFEAPQGYRTIDEVTAVALLYRIAP